MSKILVVDDHDSMRESLITLLEREGYSAEGAENGEKAIQIVNNQYFDLVITDLKMPEISGLDVIREVKSISPSTEIILITAYGSIDTAVEAMKGGAYDYITKPFETEAIKFILERALEKKRLEDRIVILENELKDKYDFDGIIGTSPEILNVLKMVSKVSAIDSTILITGDSGTGKELIAKAIHYNGKRKDSPAVVLNCGALPENLHESELFGHKKGSFTGAINDKVGLIEEAHKGTLILDEVGELSLTAQVKMLRFLQNGEIRRIGENVSKIVDVRIVAMTNKDLKKEIEEKRIREDFYFRLNVIQIHLPSLRERKRDIKLLINYYLKKFSEKMEKPEMKISRRATSLLINYKWPGNIRELENVLERAVALSENNLITPSDLPEDVSRESSVEVLGAAKNKKLSLAEIEKEYILQMLEECTGNRKKTAELLGITKATLWRKLKEYNITKKTETV